MGMKNPFRRRGGSNKAQPEGESVLDVMRPWWAWGPIGLIWFGGIGHHSGANIDAGHMPHHGDAGNYHHPVDPGGGYGGFDGGGGAI